MTEPAKNEREVEKVDVVMPVYNEGKGIISTLTALARGVRSPIRVLVCYDTEEDSTLAAIREHGSCGLDLLLVKNEGRGAHGAVITGLRKSRSGIVLVYPADDDFNAVILDRMFEAGRAGADIVCASRFMKGGSMIGCPLPKEILVRVAAFTLRHFARVPTHDATNGFRLFSRRLLDCVKIESSQGFTYSLELLAKCHRLRWPIAEVPAQWIERTSGLSQFKVLSWVPAYLRWYLYIFATTIFGLGPETVEASR